MYLLDTNHCSRLIQGEATVVQRLINLGETPVATSVIVQGDLLFMEQASQRVAENLGLVNRFLKAIPVLSIDAEMADIYSHLKARFRRPV